MKVGGALLGLFIFGYWIVPFLFHGMVQHDYDNLFHGMQEARKNGGLSYDKHETYHTYADRYVRGE
jgi:hypothetical protein